MKYPSGVAETEEDLFTRRFLEETGGTCGLVPLTCPRVCDCDLGDDDIPSSRQEVEHG